MSVYFSKFPNTTHSGFLVKDISRRAELATSVLNNKFAYLPYLVDAELAPEDVAYYYYGSVRYTWLVYYSAGILDPYYDWPLTEKQFNNMLINKYAAQANTTGTAVIDWTKNTEITTNIIHYENADGDKISPESFTLNPNIIGGDWTPLRYYDYELIENDNKRTIELLERSFAARAEEELRTVLNDGII